MALLGGCAFEQPSPLANKPHYVSFATARTVANETLFEVWNGPTNAARRVAFDLDGYILAAPYVAGSIPYAVASSVSGVQRLSALAIGASGSWLGSSGTLPQWNTPAALTKIDDTNVTLTLGGSAATALLNAASITVGWTGTLADARIASAATWNAKEPGLGNPASDGYVLASTVAGVRSWVAQPTLSSLGAVPTSRTLTASTGLTGGGDLSANRSFAVAGILATLYALANAAGWLHNDGAGLLAWSTPSKSDVGLGSVENTALSTWAGSTNLTAVGTISTGVWQGSEISTTYTAAKVASVAARTGAVTLTAADIAAGTFPSGAFVFQGAVSGITTVTATTLAGTLSTAAQPNISGVGVLTSLALAGALTLGGDVTRAADQVIDLTGAATRTLTVRNSTASQVANLDLDGVYVWRSGHATGTYTFAGIPTGARVLTWPDASITVNAAGDLSGTTLAANVVSSSLTGVGTIGTGVWQGTSISTSYTDAKVTSVAGRTGAVALTAADIAAGTFPAGSFSVPTLAVTSGLTLTGATVTGAPTWSSTQAMNISGSAPAGSLTGNTLASGVTASSLTSVGTLTSLAVGAITSTGLIQTTLTTEQARLRYDASNYVSFTVTNLGALTIQASGTSPSIALNATAGVSIIGDLGMAAGKLLNTAPTSASTAGFRLGHGTAPSSPVDGDMWTTTAGLFVRVNGTTRTVGLT